MQSSEILVVYCRYLLETRIDLMEYVTSKNTYLVNDDTYDSVNPPKSMNLLSTQPYCLFLSHHLLCQTHYTYSTLHALSYYAQWISAVSLSVGDNK